MWCGLWRINKMMTESWCQIMMRRVRESDHDEKMMTIYLFCAFISLFISQPKQQTIEKIEERCTRNLPLTHLVGGYVLGISALGGPCAKHLLLYAVHLYISCCMLLCYCITNSWPFPIPAPIQLSVSVSATATYAAAAPLHWFTYNSNPNVIIITLGIGIGMRGISKEKSN